MKVSIVTPSYNQAQFLEETIVSVLEQDYPDIEYVVVDDGSTDGSLEIARSYESRLQKLVVQENAGQVAAINRGFGHVSGALMAYVNSDDTLLPGAVSEMVAEFEADPGLALVYGDALYTDAMSSRNGYLTSRAWDPPAMVRNCDNHVVQPSSMWTRRAWELGGPFDERAYYYFDFEFYLRLSEHGSAKHVAKPWSTYRLHPTSKSEGDQRQKARDQLRFADAFLMSDRLPEHLRAYVREGRANARIAAANNIYRELELRDVRRWVWQAFVLRPHGASRLSLSLAGKSLLPKPVVRRLRERRRAAHRG
ncbi:MAG: glycosyltransferase family 2 protein [Gaiellaceae bacterium]